VLNAAAPASTGAGGDCFALFYDAPGGQRLERQRAHRRADPGGLRALGWTAIGAQRRAITVPGAVRGWEDLLARHGRLTLADVLAAAISRARRISRVADLRHVVELGYGRSAAPVSYAEDYLPGPRAPGAPGSCVADLARTLQAVADGGAGVLPGDCRCHRRDGTRSAA
jgi:gamma-glutamyltranspeptidase/glutathione hydrolase